MVSTSVIIKLFPTLKLVIGLPTIFIAHAVAILCGAIFVQFFLPVSFQTRFVMLIIRDFQETKNKSLTEVQQIMSGKVNQVFEG